MEVRATYQYQVDRALARLDLFLRRMWRFDYAGGWPDLLRWALVITAYLCLAAFSIAYIVFRGRDGISEGWKYVTATREGAIKLDSMLINLGGTAGATIILLFFLDRLKKVVGNPLGIDLKKYWKAPDYETRVTFIERFHVDFANIAAAYSGGDKLCVFVDDIDRCEPPKAADLMRAINLMIPECKKLVFVIGMDRARVAAAVALKHEKLLPYLSRRSAPASDPNDKADRSIGLEFGYGFLDKFIQVAFRVPRIDEAGARQFLGALREKRQEADSSRRGRLSRSWPFGASRADRGRASSHLPLVGDARDRDIEELRRSIRDHEDQMTVMVAKPLSYNPRRLKQFINTFRLTSYIAYTTGAIDPKEPRPVGGRLTLDLIGRFVAIGLRWPGLLFDLEEDPDLLGDLQDLAILQVNPDYPISESLKYNGSGWCSLVDPAVGLQSDPKEREERRNSTVLGRWSRVGTLMELLAAGSSSYYGQDIRGGFGEPNINMLLHISSSRRQAARSPAPT